MKRILSMVLVFGLLFSFASCSKQDVSNNETNEATNISTTATTTTTTEPETEKRDCTFRNTVWGDSIEEVKKLENETLKYEADDYISYEGRILGYKSDIFYNFSEKSLVSGGYYIGHAFTSAGMYISAYNALKDELYNKYGESIEDEIIPLEQDSLIEYAGASKALEYGYVVYRARWETESTDIMLGMMSENYNVYILLSYTDKNYEDTSKSDGI